MIDNCKLCNIKTDLKQSHIIPEWAYNNLYDKKRRMLNMSMTEKKVLGFRQNGIKEYLFCNECEEMFGKLENYTKHFYYSVINNSYRNIGCEALESDRLLIKGADYIVLKKFFISVIYRMIISKNDMFKYYNLDFFTLEKMRRLLKSQDIIPITYFPIILAKPFYNDAYADNVLITQSKNGNQYNYITHRVMFSGIHFEAIISENITDQFILGNALKAKEFIIHKYLINSHIDADFLATTLWSNQKIREFYSYNL